MRRWHLKGLLSSTVSSFLLCKKEIHLLRLFFRVVLSFREAGLQTKILYANQPPCDAYDVNI